MTSQLLWAFRQQPVIQVYGETLWKQKKGGPEAALFSVCIWSEV